MNKEYLIQEIVALELNDFLTTFDLDGRARCQEHPENFVVSRFCQWYIFDEQILASYLNDIQHYHQQSRNIITDKYAYMMFIQNEKESNQTVSQLPKISAQKKIFVRQLVAMMLDWTLEAESLVVEYNDIPQRPLLKADETGKITSTETYLSGEYCTYSEETLMRLLNYFTTCKQKDINLVMEIYGLLSAFNY